MHPVFIRSIASRARTLIKTKEYLWRSRRLLKSASTPSSEDAVLEYCLEHCLGLPGRGRGITISPIFSRMTSHRGHCTILQLVIASINLDLPFMLTRIMLTRPTPNLQQIIPMMINEVLFSLELGRDVLRLARAGELGPLLSGEMVSGILVSRPHWSTGR